ncbi:Aste57867_23390 [Aphanomyces stellatus]|uniref:Aste57867_23390 protein n=1 Tax=Aphanomyces stellatus TaxID=120398 RepID=A0A485LMM7_9STRA|nr:hypothetical protein As57867_023319 [Aphanomyces stellatus]VFU00036.1 Aste57867_23390 [Aphanomyces stellatus]
MRVRPDEAKLRGRIAPRHAANWGVLCGCAYLVASLSSSLYYLVLVQPSFANDLWWATYSAYGAQALTVDLFNALLTTRSVGSVDLLAITIDKVYESDTTTEMYPTYPRRLALLDCTSIDYAVVNLRSLSAVWFGYMSTQYCWVDLAREFEIAHTEARQARCSDRYSANGAMYLETVLRNQVWSEFIQNYGGDGGMFTISIQSRLELVPSGQRWLETTSLARATTTVDQEVVYWRAKSVTHFQLQWQNGWQTGVGETILVENALGLRQTLSLKSMTFERGSYLSSNFYWGVLNDWFYLATVNSTLVRSATNSFTHSTVTFESLLGLQDSAGNYVAQIESFRTRVGPFMSVDTFYIAVPPALVALNVELDALLRRVLLTSPSLQEQFDAIPATTWTLTPPSWANSNWLFYGGNPMCLDGGPLPYVQETFGFSDTCTHQVPLSVAMDKYSAMFAALSQPNALVDPSPVCKTQSTSDAVCRRYLGALGQVTGSISTVDSLTTLPRALDAVTGLNLSIMQFATQVDGTNWTMLCQPVLDTKIPAWNFFGVVFLFDWVHGKREVVSFEGDVASLVLVSAADASQPFRVTANSITDASRLLFVLAVYMTCILSLVCLGCIGAVVFYKHHTHGPNLFWFNRIVSSIWVGRSLVLVRGATAILVLSTTQLTLMATTANRSRFAFVPRPWGATLVLAGEATWILYAVEDFLSVLTTTSKVYGPLSCALAWCSLVVLELMWPVMPSAALDRVCVATNMDQALVCTSGRLQVGRLERIQLVLTLLALSILVTLVPVVVHRWHRREDAPPRHLLGIADYFLAHSRQPTHATSRWSLDNVSCLLAGLVPITWHHTQFTFDVKLWLWRTDEAATTTDVATKSFAFHSHRIESRPDTALAMANISSSSNQTSCFQRVGVILGLVYAVGSIVGSVSYLELSRIALANDFFWATFNMTGTHAFMANWLNQQLVLGVNNTTFEWHGDEINQDGAFVGRTSVVVPSPATFGGWMQYSELNSIKAAILGLRRSDGCSVPWIFTQYCYVDFDKRWEMANSAARQARCHSYSANGAIFLDAVLRNVDFEAFYACWGQGFDVAIGNELRRSASGLAWMATISSVATTVSGELSVWQSYHISRFETQWQNFKRIGLVNTYSIVTAYGTSYPLTLQNQDSAFRLTGQTTFKMYWGLANDLIAVAPNNRSDVGTLSLIRASPRFAFANTTIAALLVQNGMLQSPLAASLSIISDELGPFGSIDLRFVPFPSVASHAVQLVKRVIRLAIAQSRESQLAFYAITNPASNLWPAPKAWTDLNFIPVGGNPTCPQVAFGTGSALLNGLEALLSSSNPCSSVAAYTVLTGSREHVVASVILANMTLASSDAIVATCVQNGATAAACMQFLPQAAAFVTQYVMLSDDMALSVAAANTAIVDLHVQLIQFGQLNATAPVQLYQVNILDPSQVEFTFFAWNFLVDWASGAREAVALHGDRGALTVLTEHIAPFINQIHAGEMPTSMAFYMRNTVLYITAAMIGVATTLLVYVGLSRGYIEVLNLLELQRVGAIVWIGRPLLVVRSLTAVAILSTSTLHLVFNGSISYFQVVDDPWYKTLLAANEVTWLVAIVNDVAMAVTREFTIYYATTNSILVWLVAMTLGVTSPIRHSVTIDKQCHVIEMDFQVGCDSAVVTIGYVSRVGAIMTVVVGCNVLCYVVTRVVLWRYDNLPRRSKLDSFFVYAGARYLFLSSAWIHNDVYYMDRMSAVLNGILTLRWDQVIYGLDIKLWRTFRVVDLSIMSHSMADGAAPKANHALPLVLHRE